MTLCFDLDGTLADLYSVSNWLEKLRQSDPSPYLEATPLMRFSYLARLLNAATHKNIKLVIVSWTSKSATAEYCKMIEAAKKQWLKKHLPSVMWDEMFIVPYGVNKAEICGACDESYILFDDEDKNRNIWEQAGGQAFNPDKIFEILKAL